MAKRLNKFQKAVDELGLLQAQLAPLVEKEAALKKLLATSPKTPLEGEFFRCTISTFDTIRYKAEALRALVPAATLELCESKTPTTRVTCSARKGVEK